MIITFESTVIADYTASPKIAAVIEGEWGQEALVQIKPRYNSPVPFKAPRGNVAGQFVFVTRCSQTSVDNATTYLKNMLALVGDQGLLVVTPLEGSAVALTFANAICRSCKRIGNDMQGVGVALRWVFEITTVT